MQCFVIKNISFVLIREQFAWVSSQECEKGNKVVASFTIDLAEYAHIDGSK